jgi:hypothetical protein
MTKWGLRNLKPCRPALNTALACYKQWMRRLKDNGCTKKKHLKKRTCLQMVGSRHVVSTGLLPWWFEGGGNRYQRKKTLSRGGITIAIAAIYWLASPRGIRLRASPRGIPRRVIMPPPSWRRARQRLLGAMSSSQAASSLASASDCSTDALITDAVRRAESRAA